MRAFFDGDWEPIHVTEACGDGVWWFAGSHELLPADRFGAGGAAGRAPLVRVGGRWVSAGDGLGSGGGDQEVED